MLAENQLFQGQALRQAVDTVRDQMLKGWYDLEGQSRLFAIAADVEARDAEIQRSYDEETLAIRNNAEALFQQLRTQEDANRQVAAEAAALRASLAEATSCSSKSTTCRCWKRPAAARTSEFDNLLRVFTTVSRPRMRWRRELQTLGVS